MSFYRRAAIVLIALVMALGVYHAFRPYGWSSSLIVPKGVKAATVNYTCGPPWGSSYVHGPAVLPYAASNGSPCGQRGEYRAMIAVDVVVGVAAIGFLAGWPRRFRAQPTPT